MENNPTIPAIKALLSTGETQQALAQLVQLTRPKGGPAEQAAQLLQAGWMHIEEDLAEGSITPEEALPRRERILSGTQRLLDELEAGKTVGLEDLQSDILPDLISRLRQMKGKETALTAKLLQQQLTDLERKAFLVDPGEILRTRNRITYAALTLLRNPERETRSKPSTRHVAVAEPAQPGSKISPAPSRWQFWVVVLIVLALAMGIFYGGMVMGRE